MSRKISRSSPAAPRRTAKAPATLLARKYELVKSAIWDAATDLFTEKGYEETTVEEIADRAGLSKRSFFRYFSSKRDLMASGFDEYGAFLTAAIRACPSGDSVAEVVRRVVGQVAQQCTALPRTRKVMQVVAMCPSANDALNSRAAELRARVEAAYASRGGAFHDLGPGVLTHLTFAFLDVAFHVWFRQGAPDIDTSVDRVFATLSCMVCDGENVLRRKRQSRGGARPVKPFALSSSS